MILKICIATRAIPVLALLVAIIVGAIIAMSEELFNSEPYHED